MKLIPVGEYFTQVDDWTYPWLSRYKWIPKHDGNRVYAYRILKERPRQFIVMHRVILLVECPNAGLVTDHKDGNPLNNQVENLRWATGSQNGANKIVKRKYKGFSWDPTKRHWKAVIGFNGKKIKLGTSSSEEKVARFYDQAARMLFGPFARLNFPGEEEKLLKEAVVERLMAVKPVEFKPSQFHRFVESEEFSTEPL